MNHPGGKLIDFACRKPNGSLENPYPHSRQARFCPDCQFGYKETGCIFTPTRSNSQAFGRNASAKPRREYAPRRKKINNPTGGKWEPKAILERIVEHYEKHGEWPLSTTAYRDNQSLPHSSTVKRHFGGIAQAVAEAKILREKEIAERD